ncbi:MAG: hypothetical protein KY461_07870 [Actinobacteria bacterium]|nr:hypothetical protein [Actinomycetota bacterium]
MTASGTVHDALADRAFLHDDPAAYLAGVDDAVAEVDERDDDDTQDDVPEDLPAGPAAT